jgi:leader peptidase (prepilin peptidase)/N-methyltransferase
VARSRAPVRLSFGVVTTFVAAICGVFGLVIGSFLNVVIWRVPRHESIVSPPSHCPSCDAPIAPFDNIPVASWFILRGRCRRCGAHISFRYPFIELLTAVLFVGVGAVFHDSWALPAYLLLTAALVALSAIDLELYILPNRIIYPVAIASVPMLLAAALLDGDTGAFLRACLGGAIAFAFFFIVHIISPRGMGFGDVRLSLILGLYLAYLGWKELAGGLFAGFLYGAVIGVLLIALKIRSRKQHIPFGPFLAAGTMTFVLFSEPILNWYLGR